MMVRPTPVPPRDNQFFPPEVVSAAQEAPTTYPITTMYSLRDDKIMVDPTNLSNILVRIWTKAAVLCKQSDGITWITLPQALGSEITRQTPSELQNLVLDSQKFQKFHQHRYCNNTNKFLSARTKEKLSNNNQRAQNLTLTPSNSAHNTLERSFSPYPALSQSASNRTNFQDFKVLSSYDESVPAEWDNSDSDSDGGNIAFNQTMLRPKYEEDMKNKRREAEQAELLQLAAYSRFEGMDISATGAYWFKSRIAVPDGRTMIDGEEFFTPQKSFRAPPGTVLDIDSLFGIDEFDCQDEYLDFTGEPSVPSLTTADNQQQIDLIASGDADLLQQLFADAQILDEKNDQDKLKNLKHKNEQQFVVLECTPSCHSINDTLLPPPSSNTPLHIPLSTNMKISTPQNRDQNGFLPPPTHSQYPQYGISMYSPEVTQYSNRSPQNSHDLNAVSSFGVHLSPMSVLPMGSMDPFPNHYNSQQYPPYQPSQQHYQYHPTLILEQQLFEQQRLEQQRFEQLLAKQNDPQTTPLIPIDNININMVDVMTEESSPEVAMLDQDSFEIISALLNTTELSQDHFQARMAAFKQWAAYYPNGVENETFYSWTAEQQEDYSRYCQYTIMLAEKAANRA